MFSPCAQIRVFRPWNSRAFLGAMPATVRKVCVLDRTKESGSGGEPLYQQVCAAMHEAELSDPSVP